MRNYRHIKVNDITFGNDLPFVLIAGPCQMENRDHAVKIAEHLLTLTQELKIPFVYKTSFDKANRTSLDAVRGMGLSAALPVFRDIKEQLKCTILTDIHNEEQSGIIADVVDIIQIPAFLCRQTDIVVAAAQTGRAVNVKKGQFLAPGDMTNVVKKIEGAGNTRILLTERGVSFGYNTLIVDPRSIPLMSQNGYPVVIDATHSVQQPGALGEQTGGDRAMAPVIARAAVANGVAAVFIETHDDPDNAPSDATNMIPLDQMKDLLSVLLEFDAVAKRRPLNL